MRNDSQFSSTLQFSTPIAHSINEWPNHSAEMQRKLKKTNKALPTFGWDTAPIMGSEDIIEEPFLDVFCDILYGGGWMERAELTVRDCNWVLVRGRVLS